MSLKQIKKEREKEREEGKEGKEGKEGAKRNQNPSLYMGLDDDVKYDTIIIASPVSMAHIV